MPIISSVTVSGQPQTDGRFYVNETHTADDGQSYAYEWLCDGMLDPNLVMEERAKVINATMAAREAARLAVVGTSVPLTRFQFLDRFTSAERIAIRNLAKTDGVVDDFMHQLDISGNVSLALARPGLQYLAFKGVITADRATVIGAE